MTPVRIGKICFSTRTQDVPAKDEHSQVKGGVPWAHRPEKAYMGTNNGLGTLQMDAACPICYFLDIQFGKILITVCGRYGNSFTGFEITGKYKMGCVHFSSLQKAK